MKAQIKLIREYDGAETIKEHILKNRGIVDPKAYMHLGKKNLNDFHLLGEDLLESVCYYLNDAMQDKRPIWILVDTDVDGYCSAAILFRYLTETMALSNVNYILNKDKVHGLTEDVARILASKCSDVRGLLFIPDAGTNDTELCKMLSPYFDIVIIDHHEQDTENKYATIINPKAKNSLYPNKNLCGAAVVYKVLQYFDEFYFRDSAENLLDLVGVAMVADIIDLRDLESRYLVTCGLMTIQNKLIKAIINKNAYSISNTEVPNALDIAFYISPYINACIRTGTPEENELLFRGFIEQDRGQTFRYKPRKSKNNPEPVEIDENFYDHLARMCANLKTKQDKLCEKSAEQIAMSVTGVDKVVIRNVDKMIETEFNPNLIGVLASRLCNQVKYPVILLHKISEDENGKLYSGSARNFNNSYVYDFRQDVNDSGAVALAAGHSSAFGVKLYGDKVRQLVNYFNEKYKENNTEKTYYVDFALQDSVPFILVKEIDEMKSMFSNFVEEPYVFVGNVKVNADDVKIETAKTGAQNKRFHFVLDDIEYVKFKLPENDDVLNLMDDLLGNETLVFNFVGRVKVNLFGGKCTPQFIIDDYDVRVV